MKVAVEATALREVLVVRPEVFGDARGWFSEVFRADVYADLGLPTQFVQFNRSRSARHVIRGLHFQWDPPMGKLQTVSRGAAFLVAVDVRPGSPTLGKWIGMTVSEQDRTLIWAPAHFARGFCALTDDVDVDYLCTGTYNGANESAIRWDDPAVGIEWPTDVPVLSDKDRRAGTLADWLQRPESRAFSFEPAVRA